MSFSYIQWKRKYDKDMVCSNYKDIERWLKVHQIYKIPPVVRQYPGWVCKKNPPNLVCLNHDTLILNVNRFPIPYRFKTLSLFSIKLNIKREYFKIFGNSCKIKYIDIRTIEKFPVPRLKIQIRTITATVEAQHKEERSGYKISQFYLKRKNRRNSDPRPLLLKPLKPANRTVSVPEINSKKMSLADLVDRYRWSTPRYHKKLVKYFTDDIKKNIKHPRLVLMFGLPGSGKNWLLNKRMKLEHVVINVDDCLAMLPDYWRGMLALQEREKRATDWIRTFSAECKEIARLLFQYAIENRMNIVWNGTGKNIKKYKKFIRIAKEAGYIIELNGIWVPLKVAKKRVRERRNSYGRDVPENILDIAALDIPQSFKNLRKDSDYARLWKNMFCQSPKVIWDKQQGWIGEFSTTSLDRNKWIPVHK